MRATLLAAIIALTFGLVGVGQAAELESCHGTSSVVVQSAFDSFQHACTKTFTVAADSDVTLSVTPGAAFTGSVLVRLQLITTGHVDVAFFGADFLLGTPQGSAESDPVSISAGLYKLIVYAQFPSIGDYTGTVSSVEASPSPSPSST